MSIRGGTRGLSGSGTADSIPQPSIINHESYQRAYAEHLARIRRDLTSDAAFAAAVGGDFESVGKLEFQLLVSLGLTAQSTVVDVGCGSGRLACQLAPLRGLRYTGTDVVPDLLHHARKLTQRPDWEFVSVHGTTIPCPDRAADFICFFSVFTHILHEDTYLYLQEAARVVKRGAQSGRMVFSFLEFRIPCHWQIFEHTVRQRGTGLHHNQFLDRDAIHAWADHLDLAVEDIWDGDKPHIPLTSDVVAEDGRVFSGRGNPGQSVAVLRPR